MIFPELDPATRSQIFAHPEITLPKGSVIFRAGDAAEGFALVLSGRVEVFLTGASGREVMLYAVEPGETCVQTTLSLLGAAQYSGEGVAASDLRLVMIPRAEFAALIGRSESFRGLVFGAFAARMADMVGLLERVAFQSVESRLAGLLVGRGARVVHLTQAQIAAQIGTAREVVSRRLDAMVKEGLIETARGEIRLLDRARLERLAGRI